MRLSKAITRLAHILKYVIETLTNYLGRGRKVDYSFRIRFNRSATDTIQTDASEMSLPVIDSSFSIVLHARQDELKICDSDQLAIIGSGYNSLQSAETAGQEVKKALSVALARVRVGADFGGRSAKGMFTSDGLKWVEQQINQRALNNTHGLMTFETFPKPRFASTNAQMTRGSTPESFVLAYAKSLEVSPTISECEELSYTLFNASFFQPTADSRFLLLIMAIEALIRPEPRSSQSLGLVESFIKQTKELNLPDQEKNSILGTLRWLKVESINQAGRRMVIERLGNRTYLEMTASDFFTHCYQIRSNLVHGNLPSPSFEEIGRLAATAEVFVSELLTIPILGDPP